MTRPSPMAPPDQPGACAAGDDRDVRLHRRVNQQRWPGACWRERRRPPARSGRSKRRSRRAGASDYRRRFHSSPPKRRLLLGRNHRAPLTYRRGQRIDNGDQIARPDSGFLDSARRRYLPETRSRKALSSAVRLSTPVPGDLFEEGIDLHVLLFVRGQARTPVPGSEWAVEKGREGQEERIEPQVDQQAGSPGPSTSRKILQL